MNSSRNFSWEVCEGTVISSVDGRKKDVLLSNDWKKKNTTSQTDFSMDGFRMTLTRDFLYDSVKKEFRWHKTWCLPLIQIHMPTYQQHGGKLLVRIHCVIPGGSRGQFEDVGLKGQTSQQLVNGECTFSRLRFVSTSNLHGGKKFHLILSVWCESVCLLAYVSSGISVYSRKDADKKRKKAKDVLEERTVDTAFRVFSPSLFDRDFVKKVNDHKGHTICEKIDNSLVGLVNYFQAPNIRAKCRHPVFLLCKFNNVLSLARNVNLFPEETKEMFYCFLSDLGIGSNNFQDHSQYKDTLSTTYPRWFIILKENNSLTEEAKRRISENMKYIECRVIGFVQSPLFLPEHYRPVQNVVLLRQLYERCYSSFLLSSDTNVVNDIEIQEKWDPVESSQWEDIVNNIETVSYSSHDSCNISFESYTTETLAGENICTNWTRDSFIETKSFLEHYFRIHHKIRQLLFQLTDGATQCMREQSQELVDKLKIVYRSFFRLLSAHAHAEDTIIFPQLAKKIPGITEAYHLDHFMEGRELASLGDMIENFVPEIANDVFRKVTSFSARFLQHMEKEEEHLIPYLVHVFSDHEIAILKERVILETNNVLVDSEKGETESLIEVAWTADTSDLSTCRYFVEDSGPSK
ncbi:zinc finger-like protein [Galdieria sulphuraria]|uniref:Zinc finger-like protein n=1 Tax=Galdieria sulphuraria TaxID=130081 RepID=M2Y6S9_GALSU|nr:zinc finger-like protein [Galdieria sulphuraria]EME31743.1 zinc finger-like protein [Galdieria sulphuraria]|eukprot:XP_005708263.1 zinc finger-like protein [Galdieria sulphuraria]